MAPSQSWNLHIRTTKTSSTSQNTKMIVAWASEDAWIDAGQHVGPARSGRYHLNDRRACRGKGPLAVELIAGVGSVDQGWLGRRVCRCACRFIVIFGRGRRRLLGERRELHDAASE